MSMRWYIRIVPKIGDGTYENPYRPDISMYPTATQWSVIQETETEFVIKIYM